MTIPENLVYGSAKNLAFNSTLIALAKKRNIVYRVSQLTGIKRLLENSLRFSIVDK